MRTIALTGGVIATLIVVSAVVIPALMLSQAVQKRHLGSAVPETPVNETTFRFPAGGDVDALGVSQPVRRVGTIAMQPGHQIDLDALATADWGYRKGNPYPPEDLEFELANHALTGDNPAVLGILAAGSKGTRRECGVLQAYGVELLARQIKPGTLFCVKTDRLRLAVLHIGAVTYDAQGLPARIVLDIKVWEPPDSN